MCRLGHCHNGSVYTMTAQHIVNDGHGSDIGICGILSTLEYTCVAALEAQAEYIKSDIGASLIDDRNDAERHADTANV